MKRKILLLMTTALLSVGAWAANDLTLNPNETKGFSVGENGVWGFDNSAAPTLVFSNWADGGWQFDTPLSQDDYCGVDIAFEATTETHVTFFIDYEGGAEQSIDVPTGSTGIKADFVFTGGITKIRFKYGDWEDTANPDGCSITITKAVVKAESTGEVVELPFADLSDSATDPETGAVVYTKDADNQTITINHYKWASYWSFNPAILSDDYEKIVVTFAEPIAEDGLTINPQTDNPYWCDNAIGSITKDGTKATAYFSNLSSASITRVGFYFNKYDVESTSLRINSAKLYKKTEFVRTISDALYATTSFPAAVDFSQTSGIKAYIAKVNDAKTKVELTEVNKVAAGVPVILNGSATDYTLHYTTESIEDVSDDNQLKVSDGMVTGDGSTIYVLANKTPNGVGFYLVEYGSAITAGKAYLKVSGENAARQFIGFGDDNETTGIQTVANSQQSAANSYYDLQGRRVAQPAKGLYIVNGKKVIIK